MQRCHPFALNPQLSRRNYVWSSSLAIFSGILFGAGSGSIGCREQTTPGPHSATSRLGLEPVGAPPFFQAKCLKPDHLWPNGNRKENNATQQWQRCRDKLSIGKVFSWTWQPDRATDGFHSAAFLAALLAQCALFSVYRLEIWAPEACWHSRTRWQSTCSSAGGSLVILGPLDVFFFWF